MNPSTRDSEGGKSNAQDREQIGGRQDAEVQIELTRMFKDSEANLRRAIAAARSSAEQVRASMKGKD
jgi:hypothetical protein